MQTADIRPDPDGLDHFAPSRRRRALEAQIVAQPARLAGHRPGNLHAHSFFSFNCHGWSPTHYAIAAAQAGFSVAGLVDFDVLDGIEEFHRAGSALNLRTVASLETRVFVPEFADRVINSPGEPGIAYHMAAGFASIPRDPEVLAFLDHLRASSDRRNRELVTRVNAFLDPVRLDYAADVLPLTPAGNATERHICLAYGRKAAAQFQGLELQTYWISKLGNDAASLDFPEGPRLINALRARTMKRGGAGYIQPGRGSFPLLEDFNRFARAAGAIPMITWLDGSSAGEQAIEEWFDVAQRSGAAALNIIPDRNFTRGVEDDRLRNLRQVLAVADRRGLPVIGGTELNALGQKFVDDWDAPELVPHVAQFQAGAFVLYAHTVLQRAAGIGYTSAWATKHFPEVTDRNRFFATLGQSLTAATEGVLENLTADVTPDDVRRRAC